MKIVKLALSAKDRAKKVGLLTMAWRRRGDLARMIGATVKGTYRMSFFSKLVLIAGLLYMLSPIDLIPDFIPVIGWADDFGILFLLIKKLIAEADRYVQQQASRPFELKRI